MSHLPLFISSPLPQATSSKSTLLTGEILSTPPIPVVLKQQIHSDIREVSKAMQEAITFMALQHPNIVKMYDFYVESHGKTGFVSNLVMERMERDLAEEVYRRTRKEKRWEEWELVEMMRDVVKALNYAEKQGVSHRDIKPQNILITGNIVKIADFGSAKRHLNLFPASDSLQGSFLYLSPELKRIYEEHLRKGPQKCSYDSTKSDIYSLGVTFLELALLKQPEELKNLEEIEENTEKLLGKLDKYANLRVVLTEMLKEKPENRPSFEKIEEYLEVNREYFEGLKGAEEAESEIETERVVGYKVQDSEAYRGLPWAEMEGSETVWEVKCRRCTNGIDRNAEEMMCERCRGSVRCAQCNEPIIKPLADLPEDLFPLVASAHLCCSESCLRQFTPALSIESTEPIHTPICQFCFQTMTDPPCFKMRCGHFAHDLLCLFQFIARETLDFTICKSNFPCPQCNLPLDFSELVSHFPENQFEIMQKHLKCPQCGSHIGRFGGPIRAQECFQCHWKGSS